MSKNHETGKRNGQFGPDSTNPRQRRAFANALLAKTRKSGDAYTAIAAIDTVNALAGGKAERSGLKQAAKKLPLSDAATRTIVEVGDAVMRGEAGKTVVPSQDPVCVLFSGKSEDFSLDQSGVYMRRYARLDGGFSPNTELTITDHSRGVTTGPEWIPVTPDPKGEVDMLAVRKMPGYKRRHLADLASRIVLTGAKR